MTKIVGVIFQKIKILIFFLIWTTLNFGGRSKAKKWAKDICRGTVDIECKRDWPVGLGATLGDGQKIKNYFSSFRDFSEKADSVILLRFECTINPLSSIKIVGAIFEKINISNFFVMWTTLNFRSRGKTKKTSSRYLQEGPRYRIWMRLVSWFRRYVRWRTEN